MPESTATISLKLLGVTEAREQMAALIDNVNNLSQMGGGGDVIHMPGAGGMSTGTTPRGASQSTPAGMASGSAQSAGTPNIGAHVASQVGGAGEEQANWTPGVGVNPVHAPQQTPAGMASASARTAGSPLLGAYHEATQRALSDLPMNMAPRSLDWRGAPVATTPALDALFSAVEGVPGLREALQSSSSPQATAGMLSSTLGRNKAQGLLSGLVAEDINQTVMQLPGAQRDFWFEQFGQQGGVQSMAQQAVQQQMSPGVVPIGGGMGNKLMGGIMAAGGGWMLGSIGAGFAGEYSQARIAGRAANYDSAMLGAINMGSQAIGIGAMMLGGPPGMVIGAATMVGGGIYNAVRGAEIEEDESIRKVLRSMGASGEDANRRVANEMGGEMRTSDWFAFAINPMIGGLNMARKHLQAQSPEQDRLTNLLKGLSQQEREFIASETLAGRSPDVKLTERLTTLFPDNPEVRGAVNETLQKARYSDLNLALHGLPKNTGEIDSKALRSYIEDDPLAVAYTIDKILAAPGALKELGVSKYLDMQKDADDARRRAVDHSLFKKELGASQAEFGLSSARLGRARFRGSAGIAGARGEFDERGGHIVSLLRQEASRTTDPWKQRELLAMAEQTQLANEDSYFDAYFGERQTEVSAFGNLDMGRADRGFLAALYSGAATSGMPWESVTGAQQNHIGRIRDLMEEKRRAGRLSPAEEAMYKDQIEQGEFEISTGIPRRREQMGIGEKISQTGLDDASRMAGVAQDVAFGSETDRLKGLDAQLDSLRQQRQVLQEILDTSKFLTLEEKTRYQTQIEATKTQEVFLRAQRAAAEVRATYNVGTLESRERNLTNQVNQILGIGDPTANAMARYQEEGVGGVSRAQAYHDDLIAKGFSPDSPEVQGARNQIVSARTNEARMMRNLATPEMAEAQKQRLSNLGTELAIAEAGFAPMAPGKFRENIMQQMGEVNDYGNMLHRNRQNLIEQGKWTPGMETDFTKQVNGMRREMAGMATQYSRGFVDRMISEAFNMPTSETGQIFSSMWNPLRAAMEGGLGDPAFGGIFGGTEEQTRRARESYFEFMPRFGGVGGFTEMSVAGATSLRGHAGVSGGRSGGIFGDVEGGSQSAVLGVLQEILQELREKNLSVSVNVDKNGGVSSQENGLWDNRKAIHQAKTAMETTENAHQRTRPSG